MVPGFEKEKTLGTLGGVSAQKYVSLHNDGMEAWKNYHALLKRAESGDTASQMARRVVPTGSVNDAPFRREKRHAKRFQNGEYSRGLLQLRTMEEMGFFSGAAKKPFTFNGQQREYEDFRTLKDFDASHGLFPLLSFLMTAAYWNGSMLERRGKKCSTTTELFVSPVLGSPALTAAFLGFLTQLESQSWFERRDAKKDGCRFVGSKIGRLAKFFFKHTGRRSKSILSYPQFVLSALQSLWTHDAPEDEGAVARAVVRDFILIFFASRLKKEDGGGYVLHTQASRKESIAQHRRNVLMALISKAYPEGRPSFLEPEGVVETDSAHPTIEYRRTRFTIPKEEQRFVLDLERKFQERVSELLRSCDRSA